MYALDDKIRGAIILVGLLLVCFAANLVAQSSSSPPASPSPDNPPQNSTAASGGTVSAPDGSAQIAVPPGYKIAAGDMLDVTVFGVPDLSQKTRVNSNGEIYLALVNYVHVAGMDLQEAQAAIENVYTSGRFLTSPHVSVSLAEQAGGVVVMGEVARPGIYTVTASKDTLYDILTEAGGTTQVAGKVITITHRREPDHPQTVVLSSDPKQMMAANVPVTLGDVIMVSKAGVIYVVGEVVQPSGFIMESNSGYTALKALAMAHGATRLAKLSDAKIVRQTPQGVKVIPVPLNKIAQDKAPDTELLAGDILMVPISHVKATAMQAASLAQSVATVAAVSAF